MYEIYFEQNGNSHWGTIVTQYLTFCSYVGVWKVDSCQMNALHQKHGHYWDSRKEIIKIHISL